MVEKKCLKVSSNKKMKVEKYCPTLLTFDLDFGNRCLKKYSNIYIFLQLDVSSIFNIEN